MRNEMTAIIRKDIRSITVNKRMFSTLFIVPMVLVVVVPSIFILLLHFMPQEVDEFQQMLAMMPLSMQPGSSDGSGVEIAMVSMILNYVMPVFFLMIPIMAASIMAASSFVGEKEKRTLETLLYSPISVKQIFQAKVLAAFLLSMMVSLASFVVMTLVVETELYLLNGALLLPDGKWLLILLWLSPVISLIAITIIVRFSAKAQSMEDAQQGVVFLLIPIILLVGGQFSGILLINAWILVGLGAICTLVAWLLLKKAVGRFSYEELLK